MDRKIKICDATIWLGEQTPGYSMSAKEKLETAKQLERLGVDVIEVGYVLPQNTQAIEDICRGVADSTVCVMCDASAAAVEAALEATKDAARRRIDIVAAEGADITRAVGLAAQKAGVEVTLRCSENIVAEARAAVKAGASTVCVCDADGLCAPEEFYGIVKEVCGALPGTDVSALCGNDLGMAVANALSAVKAGASEVKCSVLGVGERAGTAALEEIVMGLAAKKDYYKADTNIRARNIYRTAKLVSTVLGYQIEANKPIIGDSVYAGASAALRPESVGVFRNNLVLGKFSTRADFDARVAELGYILSAEKLDEAYAQFTALTARKKSVSDRDVEAIVEPLGPVVKDNFELVNFVINSGTMFPSTSTIIMKKNGRETTRVEVGAGPVDASFKAIDRIAKYEVTLENYALQSVTEGEDALGDAVVKVRWNDRLFTGRGLSTDVVEASIRAYVNALNKIAAAAGEQEG